MRGVHDFIPSGFSRSLGSSPHARGPPNSVCYFKSYDRIIPACAGSTGLWSRLIIRTGDHPRMRGVHTHPRSCNRCIQGSSPHARGPPKYGNSWADYARIIPACAGSTCPHGSSSFLPWDHPRMRGVHVCVMTMPKRKRGSSPHARGPRDHRRHDDNLHRIIPACAGSTNSEQLILVIGWDHPRMRGVHGLHHGPQECLRGSSPHARGPLYLIKVLMCRLRIIPACAGSTDVSRRPLPRPEDHPRMRGVH